MPLVRSRNRDWSFRNLDSRALHNGLIRNVIIGTCLGNPIKSIVKRSFGRCFPNARQLPFVSNTQDLRRIP